MDNDKIDQDHSPDNKTMLKGALILVVLLAIGLFAQNIYSKFAAYSKKEGEREKAIVQAVMVSQSVVPGMKTLDALSLVLSASGKYVKVGGWACNKDLKDDSYNIWLDLAVNDQPEKLHWVVDVDNNLIPANDLAQKITIRQKIPL